MKILKNNIKELVIWIVYLIEIIFAPLEGESIYIYVIGLIAIRILSNTHKIFIKPKSYSEKMKKEQYYLRILYFVSFALMGIFIKEKRTDNIIFNISGYVFVLTGLFIVIYEVLYLIQRKLENKELEKQKQFEKKYDKIIFEGDVYIVTNLQNTTLIRRLAYIISNNTIGSYDSNFSNIDEMLKKMKEENYIIEETINMKRGNASSLCYGTNKLLKNSKVDFEITPEMIYKLDNEKITNRRKESMSTIVNDTNVINEYLKEINYKIVVFANYPKCYFILLNEQQIWKLNELCN